jgi:hypothetical protein
VQTKHIVAATSTAKHSPIANINIVMSEAIDETHRQLLADHKAFLHKDKWISLLQDYGQPLNESERKQLDDALSYGRKKSFKERILHGDRLYPDIYQLAKLLYYTYKLDAKGGKWFTKLPQNLSDAIHRIGKWIAVNRIKVDRPDIHLHQCADLTDVIKMDGFEDNKVYYYLPQSLALTHFYGLWGVNIDALMKPTVDDVLRIVGVLLTDEEMRDFIPGILGKRRNESGW